jgi:hypothetical protein
VHTKYTSRHTRTRVPRTHTCYTTCNTTFQLSLLHDFSTLLVTRLFNSHMLHDFSTLLDTEIGWIHEHYQLCHMRLEYGVGSSIARGHAMELYMLCRSTLMQDACSMVLYGHCKDIKLIVRQKHVLNRGRCNSCNTLLLSRIPS